jgi:cysteine desulfurase/selenocysteine lyase
MWRRYAGARVPRGFRFWWTARKGAVHAPVSVPDLGCDFYAITGHKLYGPSGSGAIWIARERMAEMRPFLGGGDMIREVGRETVTYADPPMKFEAGTPGIVQQIGLGVALDYLMTLGMENVAAHEAALRDYATRLFGAELADRARQCAGQGRDLFLHVAGCRPCA